MSVTPTRRPPVHHALCCSLLVLAAVGCGARDPVRTFPELEQQLARGTTVYVVDDAGTETRGKVVAVSPADLTVAVDGVDRRLPEQSVRQVDTYGDSLWNGLLIGLASMTPGMMIADPTYSACPNAPGRRCADGQVAQRLLAIGIGGAVGVGIDALRRSRQPVYLAQGAPSTSADRSGPQVRGPVQHISHSDGDVRGVVSCLDGSVLPRLCASLSGDVHGAVGRDEP